MTKYAARLEALQAKHEQLCSQIEGKDRDQSLSNTEIAAVKLKKLAVKDEISRLEKAETTDSAQEAEEPEDVPEGPQLEVLTDDHVSPTIEMPLHEPQTAAA